MKTIAQWEKQEYLLLSYPWVGSDWDEYLKEIRQSYIELIKKASFYQKVLLIINEKEDIEPFLAMENVEYFKAACDDTWIRDYGGIDVSCDEGLLSYDFCFNAWGDKYSSSKDNAINKKLYKEFFKSKLISLDFILEGGSIDNNGCGYMMSTAACLFNENRNKSLNKDEIKEKLIELFSLKELIILKNGYIIGDDTNAHIDTLARFIDEKTIAFMGCDDKSDLHYEPLLKMEKELLKTGFELLRLPLPKPIYYKNKRLGATYTNFIFINDALIVPVYGDKNDELVLSKLARYIKGRDIVSVDARVFLRQNGSLHCASQNYFKGKRCSF